MNTQINIPTQDNDHFRENFLICKEALQKCQKDKGLHSCLHCKEIFSCITRSNYVSASYESMSKGQDGAFEFN